MDLGVSGLASGFDWRSFVDKMVEVERAPEQRLTSDQNTINNKKVAYGSIKTQLAVLQNRVDALKDSSLYDSRTVQSSDENAAKITASEGAPLGKYDFTFTQLATAAKLNGSSNIGNALSQTSDVSGVVLSSAGFSKTVSAGTFTVNGAQVTVGASDTLQDVFDAIQTATGGTVSASYDPTTDTVSLASAGGELIVGSATDTSNFLSALKLYNNGTSATTSAAPLGAVRASATLASGNFATAIDDGGSGAGLLKINGVDISYSATGDSLNNVIARINDSSAGVVASYDQVNDRLVLSNKTTGDVGISVVDVTGNFAAATGLSSGTLDHGKNLLYSVNDGGTLVSTSNTITEESSGIPGLSVTAQSETSVSVTVGSDTDKIKTAIKDFITEYNKTQTLIDTNTASSTDANGKVTANALTGEWDATAIASSLRSKVYNVVSGFAASMDQLADLGISTNGNDNSISLNDEGALDSALANNLSGVSKLFTDPDNGIAVKLDSYLTDTAGDSGTLVDKDSKLAKDIANIDTQISDMERVILANRQAMLDSFVKMETAQSQINQQLQFLSQRFGTSSAVPTGTPAS